MKEKKLLLKALHPNVPDAHVAYRLNDDGLLEWASIRATGGRVATFEGNADAIQTSQTLKVLTELMDLEMRCRKAKAKLQTIKNAGA